MDFTLDQRLSWFRKEHVQDGRVVVVQEREDAGHAEVQVLSNHPLILVNTTDKNKLVYLKFANVADGTLCELLDNQTARLHLIECKRTIKEKSWDKAVKQFEGGLLNLLAVCGLLGIQKITDVRLYTAYQHDKMSLGQSTNPVLLKGLTGRTKPSLAEQWRQGKVCFQGKVFEHISIVLDAEGRAVLQL